MMWCFQRLFVPAPAGRKRFNVLGALHATSHALITVTNESYVNAETVCTLLRKVAMRASGLPITLVLDNARYQRCRLVQELAASLDIELLFLPPYSPHLNVIERMWKYVKKKCLYGRYYEQFDEFQQAISSCVHNTQRDKKLTSLLSLNFQTLPSASPCLAG
jgi:transposase